MLSGLVAADMPGPALDPHCNEVWLLHGTKPENAVTLIQTGLNERFSNGLFGSGSYLGEQIDKVDQYCTADPHRASCFSWLRVQSLGGWGGVFKHFAPN